MKIFKLIFSSLLLFSLLFINHSCSSSSEDGTNINTELPQISTNTASNISGTSVILGGNISHNGNSSINKRGVCWSLTSNPILLSNNFKEEYINETGNFSLTLTNELEPNTLYFVRAYCENSVGIQYGNNISFTTGQLTTVNNPTDILTTQAKLKGNINQLSTTSSLAGFVYGTSPNPNINNSLTYTNIIGTSPYEIVVENLTPNTVYYVRSYTENPDGGYYYSEQKQFKTTGYFGPAGGYVAYDKGETIDGWRYLEIHPTTLSYNISYTTGSAWGNYGTFISGTLPQFGKGLENTTIIVNNTSQANCAAKLCYNLSLNGYSDWFLPSSEEMIVISNSLLKASIQLEDYTWTSTQVNANYAYVTVYNNTIPAYELFDANPKSFDNLNVFPVRRY